MLSRTMTAEQNFRDAFERLKAGKPRVLPLGTSVSQNNVAKEAGADTSALRKSRYPALIREVQAWVEINDQENIRRRARQQRKARAREESSTKLQILEQQRDCAQSELVSAQRLILDLLLEQSRLQAELSRFQPLIPPLRR